MMFSNSVYDKLKWIAQYLLPALGALYFALAKLWSLPYGTEVVGTISAIDAFLGALLGISSINYKGDGDLIIDSDEQAGSKQAGVTLNVPIEKVENRDHITLNVVKNG